MGLLVVISIVLGSVAVALLLFLRRRSILGRKVSLEKELQLLQAGIEEMKEKVVVQKQEIRIRDRNSRDYQWITEGYTWFNGYISRHKASLSGLLTGLSAELARYLGVCHVSFYMVGDDGESLRLVAAFAPFSDFPGHFQVSDNQPLCECVREVRNINLRKNEKDEYIIRSGLGDESLRSVTFIPIATTDGCLGVAAIGSFSKIPDPAINLTERIAGLLAANLRNILVREKSDKILEELRVMSEELLTQKEELRQNLEEYSATKEEIDRKEQMLTALNKQFETNRNRLDSELKNSRREISRLLKACSQVEEENKLLEAQQKTAEK